MRSDALRRVRGQAAATPAMGDAACDGDPSRADAAGDGDSSQGRCGGRRRLQRGATQPAGSTHPDPLNIVARSATTSTWRIQGMSCGGCASSVKRILESEPQVRSATVNLATEMAVVWAVLEDRDVQDWKEHLGEKLANQLTTYGYKSNLRDSSQVGSQTVFERKMQDKLEQLKQSGRELAVSWALCAVCLLGHISHLFGFNGHYVWFAYNILR